MKMRIRTTEWKEIPFKEMWKWIIPLVIAFCLNGFRGLKISIERYALKR